MSDYLFRLRVKRITEALLREKGKSKDVAVAEFNKGKKQ